MTTEEHLNRIESALQFCRLAYPDALESLSALREQHWQLREAVLWAYQLAGVARAGERAMDNLSAVADGKPLPHPWMAATSGLLEQIAEMERKANAGSPSDTEMLDWLQSQIDPAKQKANGGFVAQTLEMRGNASIREGIRTAMGSPATPTDLPEVGGDMMERSIADHEGACRVLIGDEQRKIAPDNHLIATLCDSVRMGREYVRHMRQTVIAALPNPQSPTISRLCDCVALLEVDGGGRMVTVANCPTCGGSGCQS